MRQSILIFILCIAGNVYGQISLQSVEKDSSSIELVTFHHCDSSYENIRSFSLSKINGPKYLEADNSIYYSDTNGICKVPLGGIFLVTGIENLETNIVIVNASHIKDTIDIYPIHIGRSTGIPPWPYYECCDKKCNGEVIDYWNNGGIRIIGVFRSGSIIKYSKYNVQGIIDQRIIDRKLYKLQEQYKAGHLEMRYWKFLFFSGGCVYNYEKGKYIRKT